MASPAARRRTRAVDLAGAAAVLGLTLLLGLGAPPAHAQRDDRDALPGLIVDEAEVPVDALGQPQLDSVPGVRERQPLPAAVERRLLELSEQRAAVGTVSAGGAAPVSIAPLPGEADAPARRDAGERDPDRLHAPPPLPHDR